MFVSLPNGERVQATHIGSVQLTDQLCLQDVLLIPSFGFNLVSISKLTQQHSCSIAFNSQFCVIQDLVSMREIGRAQAHGGLYRIMGNRTNNKVAAATTNADIWHLRFGHTPSLKLDFLSQMDPHITSKNQSHCPTCPIAKQKRLSFPISESLASCPFDLIHVDIWGKYNVSSYDGFNYFLTILDDFSRSLWVFMMKSKAETRQILERFVNTIDTQFNKKIRRIQSDQGKEFLMHSFFMQKGILHEQSCTYTPQQNGRVERKHQHLLNVARALLFHSHLPLVF